MMDASRGDGTRRAKRVVDGVVNALERARNSREVETVRLAATAWRPEIDTLLVWVIEEVMRKLIEMLALRSSIRFVLGSVVSCKARHVNRLVPRTSGHVLRMVVSVSSRERTRAGRRRILDGDRGRRGGTLTGRWWGGRRRRPDSAHYGASYAPIVLHFRLPGRRARSPH